MQPQIKILELILIPSYRYRAVVPELLLKEKHIIHFTYRQKINSNAHGAPRSHTRSPITDVFMLSALGRIAEIENARKEIDQLSGEKTQEMFRVTG